MAFTLRDGDHEVVLLASMFNGAEAPWAALRDRGVTWDARRTIAAKLVRYRLATDNPWRPTMWGLEVFRQHCLALNGVSEVTAPPRGWEPPADLLRLLPVGPPPGARGDR
jgi:hypothetical protein